MSDGTFPSLPNWQDILPERQSSNPQIRDFGTCVEVSIPRF
ncbi:MAG: hypothetical protein AB1589_25910 [Cyanobacteriota bacterium]